MFLSEIPAAMPPLSAEQLRQALECADLGMSRRSAGIVLGVREIRIPKREYAAARSAGTAAPHPGAVRTAAGNNSRLHEEQLQWI